MIVYGEGERYVVSLVDGFEIGPHGEGGRRTQSVAILDSHYCYRAVEHIAARGPNGHPRGRVKKLGIAGTRCDRLNREHMRAMLEDQPPLDLDYHAELAELHRKRIALILWMRDVQHKSTRQIAERFGITTQRVGQLLRQHAEGTGSS